MPTENQEIEEPAIAYNLFYCKANALANDNDRDKISENQRHHINGINMKVLLAGNVPKFHINPKKEAYKRIEEGLWKIYNDDNLHYIFFNEFEYAYMRKYGVSGEKAREILRLFISDHLIKHMACRVGIENWPSEAITTWIRNYFGAKQLPHIITQAYENWMNYKPMPKVQI